MFDIVSVPVWLVVIVGLFGVIGMLDRIIGPSLRWFVQRKANTAIEELNTRLQLRIQPFKTTKRQVLIDRLLLDPEVVAAIETHISESNIPRDVAMAKAERYAREIVPAFNAYTYSRIGTRLAKWASTFVYRVRLGYTDDDALSGIDPDATVVFVMNHRSNMDYVLVTYLASATATLSYAVGEWARVWMLQNVIRAMGAYFIRRDSGNVLYRRVLARYVAMATRSGVTQAFFPEGGLTRDGLLREPKFGLLGYMIGGYTADAERDVVFVPVGINYDRVLEDRILTQSKSTKIGEKTFKFGIGSAMAFVGNMIALRIRGKLFKYGYACASFGQPISLKNWLETGNADLASPKDKDRFAAVEDFGRDLMQALAQVVPVLPVALVATAFRKSQGVGLSELELKSRCARLMAELEGADAHIHIPRGDQDYAIASGLRMLTLRKMVILDEDGLYRTTNEGGKLIDYYANSIAHLLPDLEPALESVASVKQPL